jgi:hypothetical protein
MLRPSSFLEVRFVIALQALVGAKILDQIECSCDMTLVIRRVYGSGNAV